MDKIYKFNTVRNFDRVQYADIRKIVDGEFNDLHDSLSDAYYNYWKKGKNKQWKGYDIKNTLEESKELFDKLHSLIFFKRDVKLNEENNKSGGKDEKLNISLNTKLKKEKRTQLPDKDGKKKYEVIVEEEDKTPLEQTEDKIVELKLEGIEI